MTPSTDCRCGEYPVQRSVRYRTVQLGASRPGGLTMPSKPAHRSDSILRPRPVIACAIFPVLARKVTGHL
jgi:hypothetical protein